MENQEALERAKTRAEAKIGFFKALGIYVIVNVALLIINLLTSPGEYWFYWVLLFWGIGLAIHGLKVYFGASSRLSRMKERMIQEELKKES